MTFTPHVPAAPLPSRPKWLSLAAIGALVIAVFSIVAGLATPLSVAFLLHNPFASLPGMPPEFVKMLALQQKAMGGPVLVVQLVVGIAALVTGIWALSCAVRLLSGKPDVRVPFRRSILALALAESASVTIGVWLQIAMGDFMVAMAAPTTHGFDEMMQTFMQAMMLISIVVGVGWGALKIAFLAWAHRYAGSPNVVAYFDR